jgi:hypothetical protein
MVTAVFAVVFGLVAVAVAVGLIATVDAASVIEECCSCFV